LPRNGDKFQHLLKSDKNNWYTPMFIYNNICMNNLKVRHSRCVNTSTITQST